MSRSILRRIRSLASVCLFGLVIALPGLVAEGSRTVKVRVQPVYPELARRMNITGTVKLQVTIAADGSVKSIRPVGGHPLLIDSAINAVKAWKFEKAGDETTDVVSITFARPD